MPLSEAERQSFLAEPHVGALAVTRPEPGRAPLAVPIWYAYEPGGELWITTGRDSAKARALAHAGRFSLLAERVEPTVRYVSVEGPVVSSEPTTAKEQRDMVTRYLPPEAVEPFLGLAAREHGPQLTFRMRPEHWLSADLGGF
ncbi:pyridoxamine 5'-phosphate oxidase family protein [Streptomyces sp. NBC_01565]|uniref:pyridoxamine 5'-phosphate oxidase family protein n=1 Tax=unclassified Streptomyces TaxID=2593676 RepID=UPI00225B1656|nr:pyridoxamine 5'-phosphate oxidase family protein [Streptomyces sp. NBC_01565]MCX4546127.1 pyridoxamine 5'-phosphate oxidase family protein [Streptomyces sp. NBC_01565]